MLLITKADQTLTPGAPITGTTVNRRKNGTERVRGTWRGVYVGVEPSAWDGEPMHVFRDGDINGVPQGSFAFPVERVETVN